MSKGLKLTISVGMFALFGCIQLGCEQASIKKNEVVTVKPGEEKTKPVASAPEIQKEAKAPCPVKEEEITSHPKDKRTIQQIISEMTGEKMGADNSGDLYHGGLTASYTAPEELLPGEGKFGKLFKFLPLMRWYDPDHYYTPSMNVSGEFKHDQCVMSHMVQTPGIEKKKKKS
mgnify:FL=1